MSFADQISGATIPQVEMSTDEPPRIWWHNGVKNAKTSGNFYTKETELLHAPNPPWAQVDRFDGEVGFTTERLSIAVIGHRAQAFIRNGKDTPPTWLTKWEKGAQIYTEMLCFVPGIDGPVVWAMRGLTGKAVTGKGGILGTYQAGLLRDASKVAGKALPLWTFWLPIATLRDTAGKIVYSDTGHGSTVTPPALYLPKDALDTLYVGNDMLSEGALIREQYADWFKRRRGNEAAEETPAAPAYRNAPQQVEDDEDVPPF